VPARGLAADVEPVTVSADMGSILVHLGDGAADLIGDEVDPDRETAGAAL
jgi:hypothetical protein